MQLFRFPKLSCLISLHCSTWRILLCVSLKTFWLVSCRCHIGVRQCCPTSCGTANRSTLHHRSSSPALGRRECESPTRLSDLAGGLFFGPVWELGSWNCFPFFFWGWFVHPLAVTGSNSYAHWSIRVWRSCGLWSRGDVCVFLNTVKQDARWEDLVGTSLTWTKIWATALGFGRSHLSWKALWEGLRLHYCYSPGLLSWSKSLDYYCFILHFEETLGHRLWITFQWN